MSIYQEILQWSKNQDDFIRDALRRIITSQELTNMDINEMTLLFKKDNGENDIPLNPKPIDNSHLPTKISGGKSYPKLLCVKNPVNISALHSQGILEFSARRLNVVYGKNGSGKSSYARIFKKLCWSRNKNFTLKKNVFSGSSDKQKVDIIIEDGTGEQNFSWHEDDSGHPSMNSIYVFDSNCADIYLNQENPSEYKPVGIDVLEDLIGGIDKISKNIGDEICQLDFPKPRLNEELKNTLSGDWYQNIETETNEDVRSYIQFSESQKQCREKLLKLLDANDPQEKINNLNNLKSRLLQYIRQFQLIEDLYNKENLKLIRNLKIKFDTINKAYIAISEELKGINSLPGFGTEHWRVLWNAAKDFANKEKLTDREVFPSSHSLEKCVLCQQNLDEKAKERLKGFNSFVLNNVSVQLNQVQEKIKNKIQDIEKASNCTIVDFQELNQHIPDFKKQHDTFVQRLELIKTNLIHHLKSGVEINISKNVLSITFEELVLKIKSEIGDYLDIPKNRRKLEKELNELSAKEFLFSHAAEIIQYHNENNKKKRFQSYKSKLKATKATISRKIGELMDNKSVKLLHEQFSGHLRNFNEGLAENIGIKKKQTKSGTTFQKCEFSKIKDEINSVLSEGEQKIVALSNFLAECTTDNRKNSIIFDDPVNSLDFEYRKSIAEQIVKLSSHRQIIVFTHDLFFLRLLMDTHKTNLNNECKVISIGKTNNDSGVIDDEINFLYKNIEERISSIKKIIDNDGGECTLDLVRKRFRMLIEKSVEEILSNKAYQRFSTRIYVNKTKLSGYIVTEEKDVDFLIGLYKKYSETVHDGGLNTISQLPKVKDIKDDIDECIQWKKEFKARLKSFNKTKT